MTQGGQLLNTNQIIVSNPSLVQQLASGKATLATIQGQQVLIRAAPQSTANLVLKSVAPVTTTPQQPAVKVTPALQTITTASDSKSSVPPLATAAPAPTAPPQLPQVIINITSCHLFSTNLYN